MSKSKLPEFITTGLHIRDLRIVHCRDQPIADTDDLTPFRKLEEMKIPVVFFDRVPTEDGYHKVCLADAEAARIAAEAIIEKKKKKVLALFGHPHLSITMIRCESLQDTFARLAPKTKLTIAYPEGIAE